MNELTRLNQISEFFKRTSAKVKLITLIKKAKKEYDSFDYTSGIQTLEEAYKLDPFNKEYDTALEYFYKALEFSDKKEVEYTLIGMVYYLEDRLDEAVESFNHAIDANADYTEAYEGRNQAMLENHLKIIDLQEALKKYF